MNIRNLRYIVFTIDDRQPTFEGVEMHNGYVFADLKEARQHALEEIKSNMATKFIIGSFVMEHDVRLMYISSVQSYGFRHDKKNVNQLKLFK